MNTIFSCIIGIVGGASFAAFSVLFLGCFIHSFLEQPRNWSTFNNVIRYSALCGAVIGLILVLGSGQRL